MARDRASERNMPGSARAAFKGLLVFLAVALPLAALLFLLLADAFSAYHGRAVCHRALSSSGSGEQPLRGFVLDRDPGSDLEVILPAAAFEDVTLPHCPSGVPPHRLPEEQVTVSKDLFSLHVQIGQRSWPTPTPVDFIFPLACVLMALPVRNWFVTGSPFRLSGWVAPPAVRQPTPGRVQPPPGSSEVDARGRPARKSSPGPPPSKLRGRKRRKRR